MVLSQQPFPMGKTTVMNFEIVSSNDKRGSYIEIGCIAATRPHGGHVGKGNNSFALARASGEVITDNKSTQYAELPRTVSAGETIGV